MAVEFEIVDVTLRDGSNAVDYQFSSEDTFNMVRGLEEGGIKWIEVGHGHGLGASVRTKNKARETDEGYIKTAKAAVKKSTTKIGCFFIQQIGLKEDIDNAVSWGLDFIRIGPNATAEELEESKEFISHAKSKGLTVHCCVRKAYSMTPRELARQVVGIEKAGADAIVIMDSAGTLLPNQAQEYVYALKDVFRGDTSMKVGYHAHDNLSLSVACSMAAIEAGADLIDTCLKGLGRSAGNAPTEVIVGVLMRMGYKKGDFYILQDIAEDFIGKKALESIESISTTFGLAGFHSSFWGVTKRIADECGIDPRVLVIELCKKNQVNPTEELIYSIAKGL